MQSISDSIIHDIVRTISNIIIDFDGPGVGHVYITCTFSRTISNSIVHDNIKTVSGIIIESNVAVVAHAYFCIQFQIASLLDNVGTISGVIIDFHGPGVEDTMLADDFQ